MVFIRISHCILQDVLLTPTSDTTKEEIMKVILQSSHKSWKLKMLQARAPSTTVSPALLTSLLQNPSALQAISYKETYILHQLL